MRNLHESLLLAKYNVAHFVVFLIEGESAARSFVRQCGTHMFGIRSLHGL